MPSVALSRIWLVLGGFLLLYVVNFWVVTQGGAGWASVPFLDDRRVVSAYFGILISGFALAILCLVGIVHARQIGRNRGVSRLPEIGLRNAGPIDVTHWTYKAWQFSFFVLYIILPAAGIIHFHDVLRSHAIVWNQACPPQNTMRLCWMLYPCRDSDDQCPALSSPGCYNNPTTFMRLADRPCDLLKYKGAGPFNESTLTENRGCQGVADLSRACEKDRRSCRGVHWLPTASPLVLNLSIFSGLGTAIWFIFEVFVRRTRHGAIDRLRRLYEHF